MKNYNRFTGYVAITILALVAISCESGIGGFDENGLALRAKGQENQSAKSVNLTVLVNDTFEGKFLYKIEIFDNNPAENSSVLLKSGVGSRDLHFTSNISVPEFHKTIYVRQTDPVKNQLVKAIDVSILTGNIVVDFGK